MEARAYSVVTDAGESAQVKVTPEMENFIKVVTSQAAKAAVAEMWETVQPKVVDIIQEKTEPRFSALETKVDQQGEINVMTYENIFEEREENDNELMARRETWVVLKQQTLQLSVEVIWQYLHAQRFQAVSVKPRGKPKSGQFAIVFLTISDRDRFLALFKPMEVEGDVTEVPIGPLGGALAKREYPPRIAATNWVFGQFVKQFAAAYPDVPMTVRNRAILLKGHAVVHALLVPRREKYWADIFKEMAAFYESAVVKKEYFFVCVRTLDEAFRSYLIRMYIKSRMG